MNLFGSDMIFDNFKLSDYGLMLASFDLSDTNSEEDLGMEYETIEEFIGQNPVPVYLGAKYTSKLKPKVTIIKNPCYAKDMTLSEHECRDVLRQLTGFKGYRNMQILPFEFDELLYFNVRTISATYKKIAGKVTGIILQMECDSQFAWSKEFLKTNTLKANEVLRIYNTSDDLYNYLLPKLIITTASSIDNLEIKNLSDDNWTSVIKNISANEIITMDSKNEILTSSNSERIIMNDFNMHFIRLVSGENKIMVNHDVSLTFSFRLPRKVGFICE